MFPALENAIALISTLPGIGNRSATRIAFQLLRSDERSVQELAEALVDLRRRMRFCSECGGLCEADVCEICEDTNRDRSAVCVVEDPGDVFAIERTREFRGVYHVLLGALSPLDGIGPEDLRLGELSRRLVSGHLGQTPIVELFIATNPTLEGDATASHIMDRIVPEGVRVTRISHGIPTGAAIEYADQSTLARSIRARTEMHGSAGRRGFDG